ncbi:helix-hairpin-helix domain-containing protein [Sphingobacterium sp. SYP-B4668]|uniref:helix-hairpin-helix domain-containing protein n=1 Tax=Sphingobacterium sp. SYP-B4668 TaxID=2996035 RepID=UPI0022DE70D3|nr:helix-hairpin-helix domain-containing protein [Sphingobacterium sp. SYP-B4668]
MKRLFDFFNFSRAERNGLFVLLSLILITTLVRPLLSFYTPKEPQVFDYSILNEGLAAAFQTDTSTPREDVVDAPQNKAITYFEFDPNNLSATEWAQIGFRPHQIRMIHNYLSKGGEFRKKEDLKKIYAISATDYARIAQYIKISPPTKQGQVNLQSRYTTSSSQEAKGAAANIKVDINGADTTEWMKLRGIGSVYANRIVKFRQALGGFYHPDQLMEVYGMDSERFSIILPYLEVGQAEVVKLPINSVSVDGLRKHPYLNNKQAIAIVNNREQHGPFENVADLKRVLILDADLLHKLEPYLEF